MVKFLDKNSGFNQWNANNSAAVKKPRFSGVLWWIILFLISWWLVSVWFGPKKHTDVVATPAPAVDMSAVPSFNESTDVIDARVQGLRINRIQLKDFAKSKKSETDGPVTLLNGDADFAEIGLLATGTTAPAANTAWRVDGTSGIMTWRNADGVSYRRTVSGDNYIITVTDEITNNSGRDISIAPYARIVRDNADKSSAGVFTGAMAYINSDIEREDWRDLDRRAYAYTTTNGFVGFADQYWETFVAIDSPDQTIRMKKLDDNYDVARFQVDAAAGPRQVANGQTETITTHLYAGPREQRILSAAATVIPGVDKTMDYGWFWFLARPMLWALNGLYGIVMNYGVAIILLTLALRGILWPLTRKSYTSMMAMQKMQPEMARIQKLYANDKPRMQMEMMRLYQTHKTSPMSGCLPMLIQIPIFFALYKALLISVQMRSAQFLWISDLAVMDPYFILPVLMGATMWWQQRLQSGGATTGNDVAAQTQRMMKWMPVLFTVMFAWMPAGLVLYWTVSNLFGIGQMYIIKRSTRK
ncbi:MAG: membrane protein insertase YidC [Alphaproteobacteria bacterium]|nr:membrane protein insertase YidC [Alphaproteobacteria bacterium]MDE6571536.1 membrane protein insertase YidC [Alphaproteobacteria bacterium]